MTSTLMNIDASYEGKRWIEVYDLVTWDKKINPYS